jgi:hypothetical protein
MKCLSLLLIAVLGFIIPSSAQYWGDDQADLTSLGALQSPPTSASLNNPIMAIIDPATGKVFVADQLNNRVLRFASIFSGSAEAVIGQTSFAANTATASSTGLNNPYSLALDASGNLWVADRLNNRVLEYSNAATLSSDAAASIVLGQTNFTNATPGVTASIMFDPTSVFIRNDTLWVSDAGNERILRFDKISTKLSGAAADGVLGQTNFTSNTLSATSAATFNDPGQIYVDANGNLWIGDQYNDRVLRFNGAAGKANGANADLVLGQTSFTTHVAVVTQSGFNLPYGVYGDAEDRLYIADGYQNNRVLIFNNASTLSNGAAADNVLGQSFFTSNAVNLSIRSGLNDPGPLFVTNDAIPILAIADIDNNRIVFQVPVLPTPLPVKLISFTATLQTNNQVLVQWQTTNEISLSKYELEYSTNGKDYSSVLTIVSPKNSTTNDYSYLHTTPATGNNYYRLKSINDDGGFTYSTVAVVNIENNNAVIISPDPATDNIVITVPDEGGSFVSIYTSGGSLVQTATLYSKVTTTDIRSLPSGTYFVHIRETSGGYINTRFIKK